MPDIKSLLLSNGAQFGDGTEDGHWRFKRVGGNMVLAVRTSGSFADLLTIEPGGAISVNVGLFTATSAKVNGNVTINSASPVFMKIGKVGTEGGVQINSNEWLQVFTSLNKGLEIRNNLDGTVIFTLDAVTGLATFTGGASIGGLLTFAGGQLKFPETQIPSSDSYTLDDYREPSGSVVLLNDDLSDASNDMGTNTVILTKIGRGLMFRVLVEIVDLAGITGSHVVRFGNIRFNQPGTHPALFAVHLIGGLTDVPTKELLQARISSSNQYSANTKAYFEIGYQENQDFVPLTYTDLATSTFEFSGVMPVGVMLS